VFCVLYIVDNNLIASLCLGVSASRLASARTSPGPRAIIFSMAHPTPPFSSYQKYASVVVVVRIIVGRLDLQSSLLGAIASYKLLLGTEYLQPSSRRISFT